MLSRGKREVSPVECHAVLVADGVLVHRVVFARVARNPGVVAVRLGVFGGFELNEASQGPRGGVVYHHHRCRHVILIMLSNTLTSFNGSSCANNGEDALNTPVFIMFSILHQYYNTIFHDGCIYGYCYH
eukprot:966806-Prorocentrum_minimum.AAC.1